MKSSDLVGRPIHVIVHSRPCRITMDGVAPLTESLDAVFERTMMAPAGPILFIRDAEGRCIGIDAHDLKNGRVEIQVEFDEVSA